MVKVVDIVAVILSTNLVSFIVCAPVSVTNINYTRWVNPCGGSTPVASHVPPPTRSPQPISAELSSLKEMTLQAISICNRTTQIIKSHIGPSVAEEIDNSNYSLSGFPETGASFAAGVTLVNVLLKEVERISKIGVFLEATRNATRPYINQTRQLENAYVDILCQMHLMLNERDQEVTSMISRDIMTDEDRNLRQISQIDQRNYLIFRDALKIFVAIFKGVDAYMTTMA